MKKKTFLAKLIGMGSIALLALAFTACENFLNGSDLKKELDAAVDYANAPYANIQILSDPDAKYTIVPSEGVYDKTYKAGDRIELDFTARSSFQFIKWVCEPEGAIDFKNAKNTKTIATVKKDDVKIKIQPKTEKRPVVTISPTGTEEKARNIAIVVLFDKEMELTPEDINRIEITSGGEDLKKHYKTPEITNKTTITFAADISNLVPVENTRTINVSVPEDFYSLADDGTKIYLEKKVENNFKINHNTLIKADIKIERDTEACELKGSSSNTYYVDDQIHVVCTPNEAYKITGWSITDDEENIIEDLESILKIEISEDKTEFTAKVLLGTEENKTIIVKPVCVLRDKLRIAFKSEIGTLTPTTGTEKSYYLGDSFTATIKFPETHKFSGWKIYDAETNEPLDIAEVFDIEEIETTGNFVKSAKFVVIDDTKNIIFEPLCELRNTLKVSFKTEVGTLTPATGTEKSYYLDDFFTATIKFPETHEFNGWKIYDAKTKDPLEINEVFDIEENETAGNFVKSATFVVIDDTKNIIMEPDLQLRKILQVSFAAEHGSTTPSEPKRLYINDTFNLSYSEDSGYAFTGWEVVDSKGNNASDCVQIIGTGREVTVKVLKDDCSITIRAKYKRRPYIVSYSPTTATDDGTVMRDRTLVVIFDKRMDPSSIYFTKDELWEVGVYEKSGEDYLLNSEYTLLLSGKDGDANRKPYGYFKTNDTDGSSYVYKNIRITKLEDENVNLLKYYGEPVFDKNNPKTLRIYTQITNVDENGIPKPGEDNAPPQNIEILVVIGSGMVYDAGDGDFVATGAETPWAYVTNRKTDAEPPVIDNESISIIPCASNANAYIADAAHDFKNYYYTDSNDASLTGDGKNQRITEDVSRIKTFNANTGYIWVQAAVTDRGSGPASMIGYFTKRYDPYYSKAGDEGKTPGEPDGAPKSFKFDFIDNGTTRHIDQKVNLAELGLDEGVYTLSFTSTDGNDHQSDSDCSYQFVYDVVPPAQIDNSTIRNIRESEAQETIKWSDPDTSDFGKTIIEIYDGETFKKSYDVSKGISSQLFDELENRKGYKYKLRSVDYSGNESAVTEWEDTEGPADSSLITKSTIKNVRSSAEEETLIWTKPAAKENNYYIVEQYSPEGDFISRSELTRSDNSKLFTGMSRGKYKYRFYSVDYANNISSNYTEWQDDVLPTAVVSNISNYRPSATYETISWANPTGAAFDDVDYMQIDQYDGDSLKNSYTWTPSNPATQNQYTGLTGGTKYTYKFSCVDYAGNKIATTTDWQDNEGPGPVTDVYGGGKKNYIVHLYFDTPNTDEFSHVEIYKGTKKESITVKKLDCVASTLTTVDQKGKHYEVQPDSNAGTNTEYIIKAFDYAGNASEVTISEGYAQPGMICHDNTTKNEVFVSLNVYENQNPVGVLYTVDEYLNTWGSSGRKVNLVYDMNEYSDQYFWGEDNGAPKNGDGKKYNGWDDYVNFTDSVGHSNLYNKTVNCHSAYNRKGQTSYTIWYHLYFDVNKQSIDKTNKVIWYVPAIDQFDTIISKRSNIDTGFNKLTAAGYKPVLQTDGKRLGSSSTTNDGDCYYVLNASAIQNKRFGIVREDRDNVGTSYWHCIAEINLD